MRSTHTVRLGMMRITSGKWTLDENMAKFLRVLDEASSRGVELAVTPESYLDGYAVAAPDSSREKLLADAAQDSENSPYLARRGRQSDDQGLMIGLLVGFCIVGVVSTIVGLSRIRVPVDRIP